jgi:hypothetical protein
MGSERIIGAAVLGVALLASAACATADPWARHDRAAELHAAAADPTRVCDVEVLNATDRVLDTSLLLEAGEPTRLGLVSSGQSISYPVACSMRRVTAMGVSQDQGLSDGRRFRAAAPLDLLRATRVRLTQADEVRP